MNSVLPPSLGAYRDDPEVRRWLEIASQRLAALLVEGRTQNEPVVRYASPSDLHAIFSEHVELPIRKGEAGRPAELMLQALETVLKYAVNASHPRFFNQNWAGADPVAILGDWLTTLLNTTAATYEMAPVFTLMENELLARMSQLSGMSEPEDGPQLQPGAHGLFTPGGATSNLWAIHIARTWCRPETLRKGMYAPCPLAIFTSVHSHYSIEKAAVMLGLGRENVYKVPCDTRGSMLLSELKAAIQASRNAGLVPFFVNATAGTTVTGGFDPIQDIADLATAEGMWMHVDACYGGTVLFSDKLRRLMDGSSRAQSLSWNPHKMMGITQQCSVLLIQGSSLLRDAFATQANYIFQSDKNHSEVDLGDLTLMCGRRSDGLKLWLTWKLRGEMWFKERIERAVTLAEQFEHMIHAHPSFTLAHPRTFANVGFWWVPQELRPLRYDALTRGQYARLHALTPLIKDAMQREGSTMLGYQPLDELPNFFRLLIMNPEVTETDLAKTLNIIDHLGRQLTANQ
ncbi:MAG: hypothetical protein KTR25_04010 [Myxococcales bacterium]|nr:hypothetical protein [Myxococcales bacterium]